MATREVELAFGRSHFGEIDMEEADRIDVEHLLPGACLPRPPAAD
jgi:hypothetical protein